MNNNLEKYKLISYLRKEKNGWILKNKLNKKVNSEAGSIVAIQANN